MKDFPAWFTELCSDQRWFENATMSNRGKNFKGAAEYVYAQLLADPDLQRRPMTENRKHVHNRLCKMDFERVFPVLQQEAPVEEKKEEAPPLTGEARAKKLAEVKAIFDSLQVINAVPRLTAKEILESGEVRIPKANGEYHRSVVEKMVIAKESKERIRACRRKFFLDAFPDADEEEIHAYWQKFDDTKDDTIF